MIELTEQQMQAVEGTVPPQVVHPRSQELFVLLRAEEYERLKDVQYDDSPWTSEERMALAWEAGQRAGWDDMDEYDAIPEAVLAVV